MCLTFFQKYAICTQGLHYTRKKGFHKIFHNGKIQLCQLPALRSRDKTTVLFLEKTFGKRSTFCSLKGIHFYFQICDVDVSSNFQLKTDIFRWFPKAVFFHTTPLGYWPFNILHVKYDSSHLPKHTHVKSNNISNS